MYEYAMLQAIQKQMEGSVVDINPLESLLWLISLPFVLLGWLMWQWEAHAHRRRLACPQNAAALEPTDQL